MSTSASDQMDLVIERLIGKGYGVHEGEAKDRPDLGQDAWWFSWAASGMPDCEVGPTCESEQDAWMSAIDHWFDNAEIKLFMKGPA